MKRLLTLVTTACLVLLACLQPPKYGAQLAACTELSRTWDEYEPCCIDVARRNGRDPSFCLREKDAGTSADLIQYIHDNLVKDAGPDGDAGGDQ